MPRNSSGTYTLPAGNPVVANTLIKADWANLTLPDIAAALTASLDRTGNGGMLAPFKIDAGSIVAPGLSFLIDSATGLSRPAASVMVASIAGIERQRWNAAGAIVSGDLAASGNLTITGTTTLTGALTISGGTINTGTGLTFSPGPTRFNADPATSGAIDVLGRASDNISALRIYANNGTSQYGQIDWRSTEFRITALPPAIMTFLVNTERMAIDAAGNVGIATRATAGYTLDVFGAKVAVRQGAGQGAGIEFAANATPLTTGGTLFVGQDSANQALFLSRAGTNMVFSTNATARMTIGGAAGEIGVGIGPTSGYKLAVNGTIFGQGGEASGSGYGLRLVNSTIAAGGSLTIPAGSATGMNISGDGGPLRFFAGGSQRAIVDATGVVGIGTVSTPQAGLEVVRSSAIHLMLRSTQASGYTSLRLWNDQNTPLRGLEIDYYGSTYSAGEAGTVLNTGPYPLLLGTNNLERLRITAAGDLYASSSGPRTLSLVNNDDTLDTIGTISFEMAGSQGAYIRAVRSVAAGRASDLAFAVRNTSATVVEVLKVLNTGVVTYNGLEVGFRKVVLLSYTGASTLGLQDVGCAHVKTDGTQVTVPGGVFGAGDVVTIVNWSAGGPLTIVQGAGMTIFLGGAGNTTGNRTLAGVGAATLWFNAGNGCVITGAGVS